jgi:hypothetical protein
MRHGYACRNEYKGLYQSAAALATVIVLQVLVGKGVSGPFFPGVSRRGLAVADTKKFEVALYNSEVRQLVREGERHKNLKDDWADTHYVEIEAVDEKDARAKIESRYPKERGFVINNIARA